MCYALSSQRLDALPEQDLRRRLEDEAPPQSACHRSAALCGVSLQDGQYEQQQQRQQCQQRQLDEQRQHQRNAQSQHQSGGRAH